MLGAIAGDVIGSVHERSCTKTKDFPLFAPECRFTDDTVLTVAVADCLLHGRDYVDAFHDYFHAYPDAGFGGGFLRWAGASLREPYQSFGNGSAMRVSPVAYAATTLNAVLAEAERSAAVSHNHLHGIRGAQATAAAVFLARTGATKDEIRRYIETQFDYFLDETLDDIRPTYQFDVSCQGSVPQSILAFLNRPVTRTQSATRSRSAATPTRWRASPARSRSHSTAAYRPTSLIRCLHFWMIASEV